MATAGGRIGRRVWLRVCFAALPAGLLVFPSGAHAGKIATTDTLINWTGNDSTNANSYSDANNWFPNIVPNGLFAVTIDSGGTDLVNLDASGLIIDSLALGGNSGSLTPTSTLNTGSNSLTIGSLTSLNGLTPSENVLTIGSQGALNIGGMTTVDTTAAVFGGSALLGVDNAGSIGVAHGGTLTLANSNGLGAVFENDGAITLGTGTNAGAALVLNSSSTSTPFDFLSLASGALNLTGSSTISGASGSETLINDVGHTINVDADGSTGTSTIGKLANFTNNSTINIGTVTAQTATVSLVIDTTNNSAGGFSNAGLINVNDGAQLVLQNTSGGLAIFNNDGVTTTSLGVTTPGGIIVGTSAGAALVLNGAGTTFKLTSGVGSGTVYMNGASSISGQAASGQTATESLINDTGHTISNNGTGSISSLAGFTNYGTLNAASGTLNVMSSANLTNWNASTNTLSGGSYSVSSGATLQLSAIGSATIATLSNAVTSTGIVPTNVTVHGNGLLTGDGHTDALAGVTSIQNSTLTLDGVGSSAAPYTLGGASGLTVTANVSGPVSSACGVPSAAAGVATLCLQNGSTVSAASLSTVATASGSKANVVVDGSTLNVGSLSLSPTDGGQSLVSVLDGGSLLVGTNDAATTGSASEATLGGSGSVNIAQGGTLSIDNGAGTFYLEGGDLTGGGTLEANLDQTGGTLNPGDPQSFDITGAYDLSGGILDLELAGLSSGQYDQVSATGEVTLDATLEVTIDPGFTPLAGDVWKDVIESGAAITDEISAPFELGGLDFSLVQDGAHGLDLVATSATPEPGTLPLLLGAMLMACGVRRRARRRRSIP